MSIHIVSKELCYGCGLCENICPQNCIKMENGEDGFLYPSVYTNTCIECGLCEKKCGVLNKLKQNSYKKLYLGYNTDEEMRVKSSSGGLFYMIAKEILNDGGVVYGAAMEADFSVKHIRADKETELLHLMTSKYVQSEMGDCYKNILKDLKDDKKVLFTGTPCQVESVSTYIKSKWVDDKLYLMDFICHGVPSPGILKSYVEYKEMKSGELKSIAFRDKKYGWHDYHMKFEYANGKTEYISHELDPYMRGFLSNKNIRNSCYNCRVVYAAHSAPTARTFSTTLAVHSAPLANI